MFKSVDMIFIALVLAAGTATYVVKYGSEIEGNKISRLEREIRVEKEAIDILKANWSLLTSPRRMEVLAKRHAGELQLETLQPGQIISLDEIPMRPARVPQSQNTMRIDNGADDINDIITGAIKPKGDQ